MWQATGRAPNRQGWSRGFSRTFWRGRQRKAPLRNTEEMARRGDGRILAICSHDYDAHRRMQRCDMRLPPAAPRDAQDAESSLINSQAIAQSVTAGVRDIPSMTFWAGAVLAGSVQAVQDLASHIRDRVPSPVLHVSPCPGPPVGEKRLASCSHGHARGWNPQASGAAFPVNGPHPLTFPICTFLFCGQSPRIPEQMTFVCIHGRWPCPSSARMDARGSPGNGSSDVLCPVILTWHCPLEMPPRRHRPCESSGSGISLSKSCRA